MLKIQIELAQNMQLKNPVHKETRTALIRQPERWNEPGTVHEY